MQPPEEALVDHKRVDERALELVGAIADELQQVGVL